MPLSLAIAGANRHDRKLFSATFEALFIARPKPTRKCPQHLCLDKGCDYEEVRALAKEFGFTLHLRTRGEEKEAKKEAGQKARRSRRRAHPLLDEPLPAHPHPLGEKGRKPPRVPPPRLRPHHLPLRRVIPIGSR